MGWRGLDGGPKAMLLMARELEISNSREGFGGVVKAVRASGRKEENRPLARPIFCPAPSPARPLGAARAPKNEGRRARRVLEKSGSRRREIVAAVPVFSIILVRIAPPDTPVPYSPPLEKPSCRMRRRSWKRRAGFIDIDPALRFANCGTLLAGWHSSQPLQLRRGVGIAPGFRCWGLSETCPSQVLRQPLARSSLKNNSRSQLGGSLSLGSTASAKKRP